MILVGKSWKERQRENERGEGARRDRRPLSGCPQCVLFGQYQDLKKASSRWKCYLDVPQAGALISSGMVQEEMAEFSVWQAGHKPVLLAPYTNCLSVSGYQVTRKDSS